MLIDRKHSSGKHRRFDSMQIGVTSSLAWPEMTDYWRGMQTRRPMMGRPRMRSLTLTFAVFSAIGFSAPARATNADEAVDQTAMAIPRVGMPGARSVALPQPLSP